MAPNLFTESSEHSKWRAVQLLADYIESALGGAFFVILIEVIHPIQLEVFVIITSEIQPYKLQMQLKVTWKPTI